MYIRQEWKKVVDVEKDVEILKTLLRQYRLEEMHRLLSRLFLNKRQYQCIANTCCVHFVPDCIQFMNDVCVDDVEEMKHRLRFLEILYFGNAEQEAVKEMSQMERLLKPVFVDVRWNVEDRILPDGFEMLVESRFRIMCTWLEIIEDAELVEVVYRLIGRMCKCEQLNHWDDHLEKLVEVIGQNFDSRKKGVYGVLECLYMISKHTIDSVMLLVDRIELSEKYSEVERRIWIGPNSEKVEHYEYNFSELGISISENNSQDNWMFVGDGMLDIASVLLQNIARDKWSKEKLQDRCVRWLKFVVSCKNTISVLQVMWLVHVVWQFAPCSNAKNAIVDAMLLNRNALGVWYDRVFSFAIFDKVHKFTVNENVYQGKISDSTVLENVAMATIFLRLSGVADFYTLWTNASCGTYLHFRALHYVHRNYNFRILSPNAVQLAITHASRTIYLTQEDVNVGELATGFMAFLFVSKLFHISKTCPNEMSPDLVQLYSLIWVFSRKALFGSVFVQEAGALFENLLLQGAVFPKFAYSLWLNQFFKPSVLLLSELHHSRRVGRLLIVLRSMHAFFNKNDQALSLSTSWYQEVDIFIHLINLLNDHEVTHSNRALVHVGCMVLKVIRQLLQLNYAAKICLLQTLNGSSTDDGYTQISNRLLLLFDSKIDEKIAIAILELAVHKDFGEHKESAKIQDMDALLLVMDLFPYFLKEVQRVVIHFVYGLLPLNNLIGDQNRAECSAQGNPFMSQIVQNMASCAEISVFQDLSLLLANLGSFQVSAPLVKSLIRLTRPGPHQTQRIFALCEAMFVMVNDTYLDMKTESRIQFIDALASVGGVCVLLPIFSQCEYDELQGSDLLAAQILKLCVLIVAKNYEKTKFAQDLDRFRLLTYIIGRLPKRVLSNKLIDACIHSFFLLNVAKDLQQMYFRNFLCEFSLWSKAVDVAKLVEFITEQCKCSIYISVQDCIDYILLPYSVVMEIKVPSCVYNSIWNLIQVLVSVSNGPSAMQIESISRLLEFESIHMASALLTLSYFGRRPLNNSAFTRVLVKASSNIELNRHMSIVSIVVSSMHKLPNICQLTALQMLLKWWAICTYELQSDSPSAKLADIRSDKQHEVSITQGSDSSIATESLCMESILPKSILNRKGASKLNSGFKVTSTLASIGFPRPTLMNLWLLKICTIIQSTTQISLLMLIASFLVKHDEYEVNSTPHCNICENDSIHRDRTFAIPSVFELIKVLGPTKHALSILNAMFTREENIDLLLSCEAPWQNKLIDLALTIANDVHIKVCADKSIALILNVLVRIAARPVVKLQWNAWKTFHEIFSLFLVHFKTRLNAKKVYALFAHQFIVELSLQVELWIGLSKQSQEWASLYSNLLHIVLLVESVSGDADLCSSMMHCEMLCQLVTLLNDVKVMAQHKISIWQVLVSDSQITRNAPKGGFLRASLATLSNAILACVDTLDVSRTIDHQQYCELLFKALQQSNAVKLHWNYIVEPLYSLLTLCRNVPAQHDKFSTLLARMMSSNLSFKLIVSEITEKQAQAEPNFSICQSSSLFQVNKFTLTWLTILKAAVHKLNHVQRSIFKQDVELACFDVLYKLHLREVHSELARYHFQLRNTQNNNTPLILKTDLNREQVILHKHINYRHRKMRQTAQVWQRVLRTLVNERGPWGNAGMGKTRQVVWKLNRSENRLRQRIRLTRKLPKVVANAGAQESMQNDDLDSRYNIASANQRDLQMSLAQDIIRAQALTLYDTQQNVETLPSQLDLEDQESRLPELQSCKCELISPVATTGGKFTITKLYIDFDQENNVAHASNRVNLNEMFRRSCSKMWKIKNVDRVELRKYRVQGAALEIFFHQGYSVFFNFFDAATCASIIKNLNTSKWSQRIQITKSLPMQRFQKQASITNMWINREISNFQYLMHLNTIAGRTYNDLAQYPVFPWVISDYHSSSLNLYDPLVFRDLTKPIGVQRETSVAALRERYDSLKSMYDEETNIDSSNENVMVPPFHHGTHYSCAGYVVNFLIRIEPFTSLHQSLQGGKFDHADRLFSSISDTYKSCITNPSDVRELIPEFFCFPDFLRNINCNEFGTKQNGDIVNDVKLPPWAATPEKFIATNRKALESEHVSEFLHCWIDLIFGYKQRPPHLGGNVESENSDNVYFHLTYENSVDLKKLKESDTQLYQTYVSQIDNFGQTPSQLLNTPHPPRKKRTECISPMLSFNNAAIYRWQRHPLIRIARCCLLQVNVGNDFITTSDSDGNISRHKWTALPLDYDPPFEICINFNDTKLMLDVLENNARTIDSFSKKCSVHPNGQWLYCCGNNGIHVWQTPPGKALELKQTIEHQKNRMSCLAVSQDGRYLACGCYDTTVVVWKLQCNVLPSARKRKCDPIISHPIHILHGHDDRITCVAVSTEYNVVLSGSLDGTLILQSLFEGQYLNTLPIQDNVRISWCTVAASGRLVAFSSEIHQLVVFSINGRRLCSITTEHPVQALVPSKDGELLFAGCTSNLIDVYCSLTLELIKTIEVNENRSNKEAVTSLTLSPTNFHLFVGLSTGCMAIYTLDTQYLRDRFQGKLTNLGF